MFEMSIGMKKGLMRIGPRSWTIADCASQVSSPPMPDPMQVPTLSPITSSSLSPASSRASAAPISANCTRSEEHTSELQSRENLVCRLLLEKKKQTHTALRRHAEQPH